jgi:hypothetical protein
MEAAPEEMTPTEKRKYWNAHYYQHNIAKCHRKTLLIDVRNLGRVPSLDTMKKHDVNILDVLHAYMQYKSSHKPTALKVRRMQELILAVV